MRKNDSQECFRWVLDSTDKGLGPTQSKLRELRLKEEKKKTVNQQAEQRRLGGSAELANESHPKVCPIDWIYGGINGNFPRILTFQLTREIIRI